MARKTRATVIGITESKLDGSVLDGEINIDGYELVRWNLQMESNDTKISAHYTGLNNCLLYQPALQKLVVFTGSCFDKLR